MPSTVTLKVAKVPSKFVWLAGWTVMVGAVCACRLGLEPRMAMARSGSNFSKNGLARIGPGVPVRRIEVAWLSDLPMG